jgi:hypothetical protein
MLMCSARGAELEREFPFGLVCQLAASSFGIHSRGRLAAALGGRQP